MRKIILLLLLVAVVFVSGCVSSTEKEELTGPGKYDDFAKCVTDSGIKMYGSYTCSICKKERATFGPSFQYIDEVECHPRGENPQTDLCLKKDIKKTPTWILEKDGVEIDRRVGYLTLEGLAEFSGCELAVTDG